MALLFNRPSGGSGMSFTRPIQLRRSQAQQQGHGAGCAGDEPEREEGQGVNAQARHEFMERYLAQFFAEWKEER